MGIALKKGYLRLVRRAYRLLRSPKLKKHKWLHKIISPIFDRELWHPCRETVAHGLAIGLFVAMLPVPGQMILAALGAMRFRANVPISIAACWVTNPITQFPIMIFQERLGDFLRTTLHIPIHPVLEGIEIPLPGLGRISAGSFILGFVTSAFLLMIVAYPIIYLLSALLPKFIPKTRYQRAKAKVLKRMEATAPQTLTSPPSAPPVEMPK